VEEKEPFILVISTNILIKEEANIIKYWWPRPVAGELTCFFCR